MDISNINEKNQKITPKFEVKLRMQHLEWNILWKSYEKGTPEYEQ